MRAAAKMDAVVRHPDGRIKRGALNPGGLTKEARELRDKVRGKLGAESDEVHEALMALIRERNAPAVIYAHTLLHGKDPDRLDVSLDAENPAEPLTTEKLLEIAKGLAKP